MNARGVAVLGRELQAQREGAVGGEVDHEDAGAEVVRAGRRRDQHERDGEAARAWAQRSASARAAARPGSMS
jgi:hypothetical protein